MAEGWAGSQRRTIATEGSKGNFGRCALSESVGEFHPQHSEKELPPSLPLHYDNDALKKFI